MMSAEFLGNKIIEALTHDQLARLLDTVFKELDARKTEDILGGLDSDVRGTLSGLLFPPAVPAENSEASGRPLVSAAKNLETWNGLWSRWQEIVLEVGDEEGTYVYQEEHWEPPGFDGYALAQDLEQSAAGMLPLLDEIYRGGKEHVDIFEHALEEIEHNIGLYPEWMSTGEEEFCLGPVATRCLLEWERLAAGSIAGFLNRMIALENRLHITGLDEKAFMEFFGALPEDARRKVYEHVSANRNLPDWEKHLNTAYSAWHKVYHNLSKNFDRKAYLDNCRALLDQNWRYGPPLVDDFLAKGEDNQAERIIEQTMLSFIGGRLTGEKWHPEKTLLISALCYGYGQPDEEIIRLFETWADICQRSQQEEKAACLKLQLVTYRQPYPWDAVVKVFKEINQPPFQESLNRLINQWREFIVITSLGSVDILG